MEARFAEYGGDVALVAINPDPDDYTQIDRVKAFCDDIGVSFPVGVEETESYDLFRQSFAGANPYPIDVIVDKQGIIRFVAREYDPTRMKAVVDELLAE